MSMKANYTMRITLLLLLLCTFQAFDYYPEDFSSLDYLMYSDDDYFLGAYFFYDPLVTTAPATKKDLRNGIIIQPYNDCYSKDTTSPKITLKGRASEDIDLIQNADYSYSASDSFFRSLAVNQAKVISGICDYEWSNTPTVFDTILPINDILLYNYLESLNKKNGDFICGFFDPVYLTNGYAISSNIRSKFSVHYYYWFMYAKNTNDPFRYECCISSPCQDYVQSDYSAKNSGAMYNFPALIQEMISFDANHNMQVMSGSTTSSCYMYDSKRHIVGFAPECGPSNNGRAAIFYLKVTLKATSSVTCSGSSVGDCPPGEYCQAPSCSKCKPSCYSCINNTSCVKCSRFSKKWDDDTDCTLQYLDISKFTEDITFTIDPIRTRRVTLGFWMYLGDTSQSGFNGIIHVVVQDSLVVSITYSNNDVTASCAINHIYHSLYAGAKLEEQSTASAYNLLIGEEPFLSKWATSATITLSKRWFYVQCAVNYHSNQFYLMLEHNTCSPLSSNSCPSKSYSSGELSFTNDFLFQGDWTGQTTDVEYRKYYRTGDKISIQVRKASTMTSSGVVLKNLYVFADYIPQASNFQYFSFHSIIDQNEMPQFVFACPFDHFTDVKPVQVGYYINPYKSATEVLQKISDDFPSNYSLPKNLYRLLLITQANQFFNDRQLTTYQGITCSQSNQKYCFDTDMAYVCTAGLLDTSTFTCVTSCPTGYMIGKGLTATSHLWCVKMCPGTTCVASSSASNLNYFSCNTGYFQIDENCVKTTYAAYFYQNTKYRAALYYSGHFNLYPIIIPVNNQTGDPLPLNSYYLEFWYLHETNTLLRYADALNHYIFYTDAFQLYQVANQFYIAGYNNATPVSFEFINCSNWRKFTIKVKNSGTTYYGSMYFDNNFKTTPILFSGYQLTKIIFCHLVTGICDTVNWSGGYYRNIRIWDATTYPIVNDNMVRDYQIYDNYYNYKQMLSNSDLFLQRPSYIYFALQLNLLSLIPALTSASEFTSCNYDKTAKNIITDLITCRKFVFSDSNNIDDRFLYNLSTAMNYYILGTGSITKYLDLTYTYQTCHADCQTCYGSADSNCLTCNQRYFSNASCSPYTNPTTNMDYWVYSSPRMSLQDLTFNAVAVPTKNKYTVSFWVKIIAFGNAPNPTSVNIIFQYGSNLVLSFDHSTKILTLKSYNSSDIATVENFDSYFGTYVYFALAYQYDSAAAQDAVYPPMIHFMFNRENKVINTTDLTKLKGLDVVNFKIPGTVWGLYARLRKYNHYLLGTYGYDINTAFDGTYTHTDYISLSSSNCLSSTSIVEYVCYRDYALALNKSQYSSTKGNLFYVLNDAIQTDTCSSDNQNCYENCYDRDGSKCTCPSTSMYFWIMLNSNNPATTDYANTCRNFDYFDMARFQTVTFNVLGSTGDYTMEFWVYVYKYVATSSQSFELSWVNQLKVTINSNNNLQVTCYPDNNTENSSISLDAYQWTYLRCSADKTSTVTKYSLWLGDTSQDTNYSSFPVVSATTTTFTIGDASSVTSWGVIFFRQIRLWGCYNCMKPALYLVDIQNSWTKYPLLYHVYDPKWNQSNQIKDFTDKTQANYSVTATANTNFFGYNVVDPGKYTTLTLCDENIPCINIVKLNDYNSMTFSNIPVSYWGRYTIEFYTYVSDPSKITQGYNMIWGNHASVSAIVDPYVSTTMKFSCFPQDYLVSPLGKLGNQLRSLISHTVNVDTISYPTATKAWIWVRCSVSWDMGMFYIRLENTANSKKTLFSEETTPGSTGDYPFRHFFNEGDKSTLIIEGAKDNTGSDVYIRTIYLFNEYYPSPVVYPRTNLHGLTAVQLPTLLLSADFVNFSNASRQMTYFTQLSDSNILNGDAVANPPSFDVTVIVILLCDAIEPSYYDTGTKICTYYTCNTAADIWATACYSEDVPLYCQEGKFLDVTKAAPICGDTCPDNVGRSPGTSGTNGLCNYECDGNHNVCKFTSSEIQNYPKNLTCRSGYTRIGYKCLPTTTQFTANILYNRCMNFPSVAVNFNSKLTSLTTNGYAMDVWFKMDLSNEKCTSSGVDKYLLYAYPHTFYLPGGTGSLTYKNLVDPTMSGEITTYSVYEWNYLLIHVKKDSTNGNSINIYTGLNFATAVLSFEKISDTIDTNILGLAFCTGNGTCNPVEKGAISIKWGAAYYKNIRIYDTQNLNMYTISDFATGKIIGDSLKPILAYFPMNTINGDLNVFKNTITSNANDIDYFTTITSGIYDADDKCLLYNSSSGFDWGESNTNQFITNIVGGEVVPNYCDSKCKRCYSVDSTKCYECMRGYVLQNGECKKITGYYLQIPPTSKQFINIKLKEESASNTIDISQTRAVTITFWIKFWGLASTSANACPILIRFSQITNSFICFEQTSKNLIFYHENTNIVFKDLEFIQYQGQWSFISISNYYSLDIYSYFPNMINFYFLANDHPRNEEYFIPPPGLNINNIDLGFEIIALLADLRFYTNYVLYPYGLVMSSYITVNQDLALERSLTGTNGDTCLTNNDVVSGDVSGIGYICTADYNPYQDGNITCSDNSKYFNASMLPAESPCKDCPEKCSGGLNVCSWESEKQCVCTYNSGKHWFRNSNDTNTTYCDEIPYIDIAKYKLIQVDNVQIASSDEYTIEMWIYLYSYNEVTYGFQSHEIIWSLHNKIEFYVDSNTLKMKCNPVYMMANDASSQYDIDDTNVKFYHWNYVQCSTSLLKGQFYVNYNQMKTLSGSPIKLSAIPVTELSALTIQPGESARGNFGFIFIRELKLWSMYNLREFTTKCTINYPEKYPSLLHYFPIDTISSSIMDTVKALTSNMEMREDYIGYNIVDYYNTKKIEEIPFTLPECPSLIIVPTKGFFSATDFLFQCDFHSNNNTLYAKKYKYYWAISDPTRIKEPVTFTIKEGPDLSEITHSFSSSSLSGGYFSIDVFCDITDNTGSNSTSFSRIELYPDNKEGNFLYTNVTLGFDILQDNLTEAQLLSRALTLSSLANNFYTPNIPPNMTAVGPQANGSLIVNDPVCTDTFCNDHGTCHLVDRFLVCNCDEGYSGLNCQLPKANANFLTENYELLWNQLTYGNIYTTFQGNLSRDRSSAISLLIKGASKYLMEDSFFYQFYNLLSYVTKNIPENIRENYDIWFDTFNSLLVHYNNVLNTYKVNNYKNIHNVTEIPSTANIRELELTELQENSLVNSFIYIRTGLEGLANAYATASKSKDEINLSYYSFHISMKYVNESANGNNTFNYTTHFEKRRADYDGYFDAGNCSSTIAKAAGNSCYWFVYLYYKINPYSYDNSLYDQISTFVTSIYLLNSNGTQISVNNCTEPIDIYFPVYLYNSTRLEYINVNKTRLDPNNSVDYLDPIIYSPVYVYENGEISNQTQEERINKYHRFYNFTCSYFDPGHKQYLSEGLTYVNFTYNYIRCSTKHLSNFASFMIENPKNYLSDGIFFYLKYTQLAACPCNYIGNICFYMIIALFGLFFSTLLAFIIADCREFLREGLLEYIKYQIVKEIRKYKSDTAIYDELKQINKMHIGEAKREIDFSIDRNLELKLKENNIISPELQKEANININNAAKLLYSTAPLDVGAGKKGTVKVIESEPMDNLMKEFNQFLSGNNDKSTHAEKMVIKDNSSEKELSSEDKGIDDEMRNNYIGKDETESKKEGELHVDSFENEKELIGNLLKEEEEPSACKFFAFNLLHRHIYISPFGYRSSFNPRYKKIIVTFTLISIMCLLNTVFWTSDTSTNWGSIQLPGNEILKYVVYGIVLASASNLFILPLIPLFRITQKTRYKLLETLKEGIQLKLLKDWERMVGSNKRKTIIGFCINMAIMITAGYMTFMYCSVWPANRLNVLIGWTVAIGIDAIGFEILIELLILLLYLGRKVFILSWIFNLLNTIRDFKTLM